MGNFTFENQGAHTFLVYTIDDDAPLDTLSLGMMTNNKIEGLTPLIYTQMDNTKYLKYNISSKISLQQYFQGLVEKKQLLGVFSSITKAILLAEEYMIMPGSILFDMDRIYVDVSTAEAELVCLPLQNKNADIDLASFFKNIVFTMRHSEAENSSYVMTIINFLNRESTFSLAEFKKVLDGLMENNQRIVQNNQTEKPAVITEKQPVNIKKENTHENKVLGNNIGQAPANNVNSPEKIFKDTGEYIAATTTDDKKKGGLWPFGKKKTSQTQNTGCQNINNVPNNMPNNAPNNMSNVRPNNIPNVKPNNVPSNIPNNGSNNLGKNISPGNDTIKNVGNIPIKIPGQGTNTINNADEIKRPEGITIPNTNVVSQPNNEVDLKKENFGNTVVLEPQNSVNTTVLTAKYNPVLKPYLIRVSNGEKISINRNPFKIGKDATYADYCINNNPTVSRAHATISFKNNQYYVMDTNSKNHTFVDDLIITVNEEHLLSNGSKIKFANEEFEFKMM